MSLRILKQGQLDSIQDLGRSGFQYLGINPGGAMDTVAAQVANMLAGNDKNEAVIELHYPASSFLFKEDAIIALSGADFGAVLNDESIAADTTIVVRKFSVLQFLKYRNGARCYLAVNGGFHIPKWLDSYSTHFKAHAGGFGGRSLLKDDELLFNRNQELAFFLHGKDHLSLPWKADTTFVYNPDHIIRICEGAEFDDLTELSKKTLTASQFTITRQSDRMGYRMEGERLQLENSKELISSAVAKGTIQLFPDGQTIILMADHQTTGGYPRIAQVISADIPKLAQMLPGSAVRFQIIKHAEAEELLFQQDHYLHVMQSACKLRWKEFFAT